MNRAEKEEWEYLLRKYLSDAISKQELDRLLQLTEESSGENFNDTLASLWKEMENADVNEATVNEKFDLMMKDAAVYMEKRKAPGKTRRFPPWSIAAAVFFGLIVAIFFYNTRKKDAFRHGIVKESTGEVPVDFLPGKSGAILQLSNGDEIVLDSAGNGLLAVQGETKITNYNGQIQYTPTAVANQTLFNTVSTPRGRQYRVLLSDGTKVWLNAGSSIYYPAAFTGEERRVSITGEVYLEVAPSLNEKNRSRRPFIVEIQSAAGKKGEIEVLGTHFNINAYDDEPEIRTTLIEGAVKLFDHRQNWKRLQPGQQAKLNKYNGDISLHDNVDTDAVLAWKNGFFSFSNTDMATLLRQIERWYDIEIEYSGKLPDRRFGGEISRESNVSQILKIMEESNMRFRLENKKIIILP